jgi:SsrA-binding protein
LAVGKKTKSTGVSDPRFGDIARNRRALHEYEILERVEAGIVLVGNEVKGLREGGASIMDAYAQLRGGEAWLIGLHIPGYTNAGTTPQDPTRTRKLLMHRREIEKLAARINEKGLTLVPLRIYFEKGRAKIELGLGRGKAHYDKRRAIAERDSKRELDRVAKISRR